jgi:hypothetical protein
MAAERDSGSASQQGQTSEEKQEEKKEEKNWGIGL